MPAQPAQFNSVPCQLQRSLARRREWFVESFGEIVFCPARWHIVQSPEDAIAEPFIERARLELVRIEIHTDAASSTCRVLDGGEELAPVPAAPVVFGHPEAFDEAPPRVGLGENAADNEPRLVAKDELQIAPWPRISMLRVVRDKAGENRRPIIVCHVGT